MQKRNGRDLPNPASSREPSMDSSHASGWRAQLLLRAERFGFLIASAMTLIALVAFFVGTEMRNGNADQASGLMTPQQQGGLAEANTGSARQTGLAMAADVSLSITTNPVGAAIYVDGDYAGVSPLRGLVVEQGRRLISIHKPDYAQFDTFLTFNEPSTSITFSLLNGDVVLAATRESTPSEAHQALPSSPTPLLKQPPPTQPPLKQPEAKHLAPVVASPAAQEEPPAPSVADGEDAPVVQGGELFIISEPAGASVWVAGKEVGVAPLVLAAVEAGAQQVSLRLDGYEDLVITAAVTAQQRSTVTGQLTQRLGTLKVLAKPWGTIYIDGELHKNEANTWYAARLTPGLHRLRVEHPKLGRWEQVVEVTASQEHPITIDFNRDS